MKLKESFSVLSLVCMALPAAWASDGHSPLLNDLEIVSPLGKVREFNRDGSLILIRECQEKSDLIFGHDCALADGEEEIQIQASELKTRFQESLKAAALGGLDSASRALVSGYRQGDAKATQEVERRITFLVDHLIGENGTGFLMLTQNLGTLEYNLLKSFALPRCEATELMSPVGYTCVTSAGVKFRRVKVGWKDVQTDRSWFDIDKNNVTYKEAVKFCTAQRRQLPTSEDLALAEQHGMREIFREMRLAVDGMEREYYSSSSTDRDARAPYGFVRCISPAPTVKTKR